MMATQSPPRTPSATLSPAAECWWERIDDCTFLVLACGDRRVSITDTETMVLRDLLNNPDWWTDRAQLGTKPKGAN